MTPCKPYASYRETGLPWPNPIPAHWEMCRLKRTIEICANGLWGDEPNGIDDIPCVRVADFDRERYRVKVPVPTVRAVPARDRKNNGLKMGDLLLEKSGGGDLQPVGAVVLWDSNNPAICSNFVARMPVKAGYDPVFLCYVHASLYGARVNKKSIKQTTGIQNLDAASYLGEKVALPPLPEQRAIAAYLDHTTARIDDLIAKKQRLLELLAERLAALISRAVTKGLNPDVELKDSGVPLLGTIPCHWQAHLVKRHFWIDLGKMLDGSKQDGRGVVKPYLRAANIFWEGVWVEDINEMEFTDRQLRHYRIKKGDLLVTEGGATVGRSAIWEDEMGEVYFQNSINRARPKGTVPTKFLYYWLYALKLAGYIENVISKATFGHLTKDKLQQLAMPVPPNYEAAEIVRHLDNRLAHLARIEDIVERAIESLREYRAALVSAAVTGEFKVTNA